MIKMNDLKELILNSNGTFKLPRENRNIEYKEASFSLPKNIWETISSFSNTCGGIIVLGIKEIPSSKSYQINGVDVPEDVKKDLFNGNHNPRIISQPVFSDQDVWEYQVNGKNIIQVYIREANYSDKPIYIKDHKDNCYLRTDDGDRKANDIEYKSLLIGSQNNIDTELLENYDLDDLNSEDIMRYKEMLSQNTNDKSILTKDTMEFLKDVGVFRRDRTTFDKVYKLTTGGLLFFGKYNSIVERFPNFQLDYFHYPNSSTNDWNDRISSGDMNFPTLNIFSFYQLVLSKLIQGISDKFQQDQNLTRGSYYSDLKIAVKEALVNVLMHPYYDGEYPIKVIDRKDFFEFSNSGNMRVSKESFFRGSITLNRNTVIANLFRKVGISEKAGSGGPRILKSALDNHLHYPDVNSKFDFTKIRIWKIDRLTNLKTNYEFTSDEKKVLDFAFRHNPFKMKDLIGKSNDRIDTYYRASKSVKKLIAINILEETGNSSSRLYMLKMSDDQSRIESLRFFKELEDIVFNNESLK